MHWTTQGTSLLGRGAAEVGFPKQGGRSIQQMLEEAIGLGVQITVCSASLELYDMKGNDLTEQAENLVGGAYFVNHGLKADLVLTF